MIFSVKCDFVIYFEIIGPPECVKEGATHLLASYLVEDGEGDI